MEYTFDQAAAALDMGRNSLTRSLRHMKILDRQNMPASLYRGKGIFVVKTGAYKHPINGPTPYTKTLITEKGLAIIKSRFEKSCLSSLKHSEPEKEKCMNNGSTQPPTGRVHDLGELTVINEEHGRCHHRVAMVVIFDSPEQAKACVKAGSVRLIPSMDLNPDATEALRHGR